MYPARSVTASTTAASSTKTGRIARRHLIQQRAAACIAGTAIRMPSAMPAIAIVVTRPMISRRMSRRAAPSARRTPIPAAAARRLRHDGVDASRRQREREQREDPQQPRAAPLAPGGFAEPRRHHLDVDERRFGSSAFGADLGTIDRCAVGAHEQESLRPRRLQQRADRHREHRRLDGAVADVGDDPDHLGAIPEPSCPSAMRFPIGSSPGQYVRAAVSFTTTTFGWPARSCGVNRRPRIKRMPIVSKYRGEAQSTPMGVSVQFGGRTRPGNFADVRLQPPVTGAQLP